MKTLIAIILFSIITGVAYARIGDTIAECINRYGNPDPVALKQGKYQFIKNRLFITVEFNVKNKVCMIEYKRILLDKEQDKPFNESEINHLLELNGGANSKWEQSDPVNFDAAWELREKSLIAYYVKSRGVKGRNDCDSLEIMTTAYLYWKADMQKAKEKNVVTNALMGL